MTTYLTVRDIATMFNKSERTVLRWLDEGREISFEDLRYEPQKDPGGHCWRFVVKRVILTPK